MLFSGFSLVYRISVQLSKKKTFRPHKPSSPITYLECPTGLKKAPEGIHSLQKDLYYVRTSLYSFRLRGANACNSPDIYHRQGDNPQAYRCGHPLSYAELCSPES